MLGGAAKISSRIVGISAFMPGSVRLYVNVEYEAFSVAECIINLAFECAVVIAKICSYSASSPHPMAAKLCHTQENNPPCVFPAARQGQSGGRDGKSHEIVLGKRCRAIVILSTAWSGKIKSFGV